MRRPVISAPRLVLDWLAEVAARARHAGRVRLVLPRGQVGRRRRADRRTSPARSSSARRSRDDLPAEARPGLRRRPQRLSDVRRMPKASFLAMEARHCAGAEMQEIMAYAASVGSAAAKRKGRDRLHRQRSTDMATAHLRRDPRARHHAARADRLCRLDRCAPREMFHETLPEREPDRADRLFRPRDHRRARGLPRVSRPRRSGQAGGPARHAWRPLPRRARPGGELRRARAPRARRDPRAIAAMPSCAIWSAPAFRPRRSGACARRWTRPGFRRVRIVASSGFGVEKCRVMADAKAPIDVVGTGSFIPRDWHETYATADIVGLRQRGPGEDRPRVPAFGAPEAGAGARPAASRPA